MAVEFFTNVDEVFLITESGIEPLKPSTAIVDMMDERIKELYPQASEALDECYAKSELNTPLFKFKRVRRFCKCNFGTLDHTKIDVSDGIFHLEYVSCPLRGECPYECRICKPTMNTKLSTAEKRVMRLVCDGKSNIEIADELYLSPNTVKRHISTSYIKTNTRNRAEFIKYANDNSIFI